MLTQLAHERMRIARQAAARAPDAHVVGRSVRQLHAGPISQLPSANRFASVASVSQSSLGGGRHVQSFIGRPHPDGSNGFARPEPTTSSTGSRPIFTTRSSPLKPPNILL